MSVLIIDYGMSNLGSVKRAFEECGADVFVSANPADSENASHIVLPGVGAFADGMAALNCSGWAAKLRTLGANGKLPILGICLGMHLLADVGFEGGETSGLGLISGKIVRLQADCETTRIPHVGWNELQHDSSNVLLVDIPCGADFYFVHSYHFIVENPTNIIATTPYCDSFASVVSKGNVFGTQFHPEKSARHGFQLIRNFLAI
jgi:glutamine amidotransferase